MRTFMLAGFLCLGSILPLSAEAPPGCASGGDSKSGQDEIYLQDSGSTNTAPFCYTVTRSGKVIKRTGATRFRRRPGRPALSQEQGSIPAWLAEKLFRDVEAAMPLSALPAAYCAKSASFGTSRYVWFKGEKSPDLCGRDNKKVTALQDDFAEVVRAVAVTRVPNQP
jgi:hypothetical protein